MVDVGQALEQMEQSFAVEQTQCQSSLVGLKLRLHFTCLLLEQNWLAILILNHELCFPF